MLTLAPAAQELPVFLSDNHAETAGWITRQFDLDEPHVLVLIDAHSDASAIERSEEIREQLRRVPSEKERAVRIEKWREHGALQAFNWIEPLMPRPLDRVLWLAGPSLGAEKRAEKTASAIESLDGRLEIEPRASGSFSQRWETCDLKGFGEWDPAMQPIILAIDLDFFAGMSAVEREECFHAIWERAMDWPNLSGVASAVSRPWLTDNVEADALVKLAIDAVAHTRGAFLEIDASLDDRPDASLKAAEMRNRENAIQRWDLEKSSPALKGKLCGLEERLAIKDRGRSWENQIIDWKNELPQSYIRPSKGEIDCDGVWRFLLGKEPVLRLIAPEDATGNVRWFVRQAVRDAYDLRPETGLGKSFAKSPARWIYEKRRSLDETTDFQLDPEKWRLKSGGRIIIDAEFETSNGWLPSRSIELRIRTTDGFRGVLSECFEMPYVFGIAGIAQDELTGVETGWGSDCSNLLIYAWRRNGIFLTWGDPGRLRSQLATKSENIALDDRVKISPEEIERGVMIDMGKHAAAIWEDREPINLLDGNDLVVHHLGGKPEIIELSKILESRPMFSLRVPRESESCKIAFAGDTVLASGERTVVEGFGRGDADVFIVNLEGIPSLLEPEEKPLHDFRFPSGRLAWLKESRVDAVSLANNHALDAGRAGLVEGIKSLEEIGIRTFGAGENEAVACQPWRTEKRGIKLAVFGISYFQKEAAAPNLAGVASLPIHQFLLAGEFQNARMNGEKIIVITHGGDEYSKETNAVQRRWAKWLIANGATLIVGAHPHVIQRKEMHGGAKIFILWEMQFIHENLEEQIPGKSQWSKCENKPVFMQNGTSE
ncbi:MAG: CapA family protein [Akkermansiaceae bacterium]|nr:CapA family protein [Akkermansiaceae bacterium]